MDKVNSNWKFILSIALSVLFISSLSANEKNITTYKGQTFPNEVGKQACLDHAQKVAQRMQELDYLVLDHSCLETMWNKDFVVAVRYKYETLKRVENIEESFQSLNECQSIKNQARKNFSTAESEIIDSYCQERSQTRVDLKIDYLRKSEFIRNYKHGDRHETREKCHQKKKSLQEHFKQAGFQTFLNRCQKIGTPNVNEGTYRVETYYSSPKSKTKGLIRGERVSSRSECDFQDHSIYDSFEQHEVKVIKTFCTIRADQIYQSILFEDELISNMRNDQGFGVESRSQCEQTLLQNIDVLTQAGKKVVHSYCQMRSEKYYPTIHYLR